MIKLSICIATLNRGSLIGQTLESMVSQLTDQVEIIVVDGASTDNTAEVVLSYQQRFTRLLYKQLEQKGGLDQDFSLAVELANGEYCWLFSDDDLIKPGAIQNVLSALKNNPGLLIVNAEVKNSDLTKTLKPSCLHLTETTAYTHHETDRFFGDTGSHLSFIGCVVIRRDLWLSRDSKFFYGTWFVHVGVIFQEPIVAGVTVLAEPMISIRYGNAMWTDKGFEISLFKWPALIWSLAGITDAAKAQVCEREPWRKGARLMLFRARGLYSLKEYQKFLEVRMNSSFKRFFAFVIAKLPATFFNLLLSVYFSTLGAKNPNARLNLIDLENSQFNWKRFFAVESRKI
jgi:glycosyltransferase involved in cell wall biosynthesis